jgi:ubiquinone biosynthesis protein
MFGPPRRRLQRWIYQLDAVPPRLSSAERTRIMLEGLGPTYVKLGQIVSSQASTLPDDWRHELDKLQNEVPPVPYDVARQAVLDELGAPPEELYASFAHEPLAAASLGQVYRATLHDGRDVVVKVQRPNLDRQVRADLGVSRVMGTYAERRSSYARQIGLQSMLEEFGSTLLDELDYYGEAYNMTRLAENLADIPGVHIPTIERPLSTKRVLTQEFISGVKISNVEAMRAAGLDLAAIGDAALRAAIKMLIIDGFFHADPHPGNLLVNLDTGVVTFLDSGMVGQITLAQRANLGVLLWTFVNGDVPAMGRQLPSLSVPYRDDADEKRFDRTSSGAWRATSAAEPPTSRPCSTPA